MLSSAVGIEILGSRLTQESPLALILLGIIEVGGHSFIIMSVLSEMALFRRDWLTSSSENNNPGSGLELSRWMLHELSLNNKLELDSA